MNDPKILIDTEGDISDRLNGAKVLVVGKDQTDTASLIKAIKESDAKIVVMDSYDEPKPDIAGDFIRAMSCASPWLEPALPFLKRYRKQPKPKTKCGLPGCDKMSEKDYCCAEHCKEHRKRK